MPKSNLKAIKLACYIGYIIQAIVINLSPILFTTLIDEFKFSYSNLSIYFFIFGKENWRFIVLFWCIIPIINFFIFLKTNLEFKQEDDEIHFLKLIKHPTFIIALIAIASGAAAELIINQWISIFIKKGLNLSILFSNLVGMCGFALMLGAGRLLFGLLGKKLNIYNLMILGSILSIIAYLLIGFSSSKLISIISCILCGLFTSILWPGTLTTTSEKIPKHGISLFAFLAASGDIGAGFAPWLLGFLTTKFTSNMFDIQSSLKFSLLIVTIFPIITLIT